MCFDALQWPPGSLFSGTGSVRAGQDLVSPGRRHSPDEPLADRVHARRLDSGAHDPGSRSLEDGVEGGSEARASVADQELNIVEPLAEAQCEVAGLLHGPLASGVSRSIPTRRRQPPAPDRRGRPKDEHFVAEAVFPGPTRTALPVLLFTAGAIDRGWYERCRPVTATRAGSAGGIARAPAARITNRVGRRCPARLRLSCDSIPGTCTSDVDRQTSVGRSPRWPRP